MTMSKVLFGIFLVITLIAFGGMLTFAMGMALVALLPALILMGPPLFLLWRVQKAEESAEVEAMRAADAQRTAIK
ncbi:hypothetical protein LVJ94_11180 [Pendulispora rubella]|uniref:Uncharacterized protein n=1 Tax=Pendulispora rubella TaxID=2741070 RepID=A0ABZ2LA43_9BACT